MARSILLAEDNTDDVFFFKSAAKKRGWTHEIHVAADGREAIDTLKRFVAGNLAGNRLSLVLLDLKMPFVGGLEVLEWARNEPALNFVPIAILTSSEQENDIETAYRLGASSYLLKPSQPDGLSNLLNAIDAYWLTHNRTPAALIDREPRRSAAVKS